MLKIIYTPTQTIVSEHSLQADADAALLIVETVPPSHTITGEPEPAENEAPSE